VLEIRDGFDLVERSNRVRIKLSEEEGTTRRKSNV